MNEPNDWEDSVSTRRGFGASATHLLERVAFTALTAATAVAAFHLVHRTTSPRRDDSDGVDIVTLQDIVLREAGRSGIDVNDLGGGIVELVGEADDTNEVARLVDVISKARGVDVVLDRLWVRTPRLVS